MSTLASAILAAPVAIHADPPLRLLFPDSAPLQGLLEPGDAQTPNGAYYDEYRVPLASNQSVTVVAVDGPSLSAPGVRLDMYLMLSRNGQTLAWDNDSAGSQNAVITYRAPIAGEYVVRATTFGPGAQHGVYTLLTAPPRRGR